MDNTKNLTQLKTNKVNLDEINEVFMWRALIGDQYIDEFYINSNNIVDRTDFNLINKKDNFKKIELVDNIGSFNVTVDNKGCFSLKDSTNKINLNYQAIILDENKNKIFNEFKNSLIMYRQDIKYPQSGREERYSYNIGYKENTEDLYIRIKLSLFAKKIVFNIELTSYKDREIILQFICNGRLIESKIKLEKNKKTNINVE